MSTIATANGSGLECPPAPRLRTRSLPEVSLYDYQSINGEKTVPFEGFWGKIYAILSYVYSYFTFQNLCGFKKEQTAVDYLVGPTQCPFDLSNNLVMVVVTEVEDYWALDFQPAATSEPYSAAFFCATRILSFIFIGLVMMSLRKTTCKINIISADEIGFFMTFYNRDTFIVGPKALKKVRDAGIQLRQL